MKASLKKIKDCRVKMVVEVEPEKVEARFKDVLKDIQKVAQLPGFRAGKAPLELVEKKYSREAHEETLKSLIPEVYHQSVQSQKVTPVTLPAISDVQYERGKKLVFTAEFERSPEFSLKTYKGIKLKREPETVDTAEVEKGMQSLLDSRAELVPVAEARAVKAGDFIVTDLEIWQEGAYKAGKQGILLQVEKSEADDFFEQIVGAKENDVREISQKLTPEEKSAHKKAEPHYRITVRGIKEKKLPELNEEFAKSFGKESVESLREAVQKDLGSYKRSESMEKMKKELFEKLLEQMEFAIPEELLARQKERLITQTRNHYLKAGLNPDKISSEIPKLEEDASKKAEEQVRLYFILKKVAELEEIEVDEIELNARLEGIARESEKPLEEVQRMFEDDLRESMVETKAIDFLIANAKFEETAKK